MDRKQAAADYKRTLQPMGIVQVKNLKTGRVYITASANTKGTINSLRFQLKAGAFATSHELSREWRDFGEEAFTITVIDELAPVEDEAKHDYRPELQALEELWLEKLQPYGERGYHSRKRGPGP